MDATRVSEGLDALVESLVEQTQQEGILRTRPTQSKEQALQTEKTTSEANLKSAQTKLDTINKLFGAQGETKPSTMETPYL